MSAKSKKPRTTSAGGIKLSPGHMHQSHHLQQQQQQHQQQQHPGSLQQHPGLQTPSSVSQELFKTAVCTVPAVPEQFRHAPHYQYATPTALAPPTSASMHAWAAQTPTTPYGHPHHQYAPYQAPPPQTSASASPPASLPPGMQQHNSPTTPISGYAPPPISGLNLSTANNMVGAMA